MTSADYEREARRAKVDAILAIIPAGSTKRRVQLTADWLAARSAEDRNVLASAAGVTPPSAKTWAMVVDAQRQRAPERMPVYCRELGCTRKFRHIGMHSVGDHAWESAM